MVVSNKTAIDVVKVLKKHLPHRTAASLIYDLKKVEGNASFVATMELVEKEYIARTPIVHRK